MTGAGLGLWQVARQPQLGFAVGAVGTLTTLYAGFTEIEHKAEDIKAKVEQGRPPSL